MMPRLECRCVVLFSIYFIYVYSICKTIAGVRNLTFFFVCLSIVLHVSFYYIFYYSFFQS